MKTKKGNITIEAVILIAILAIFLLVILATAFPQLFKGIGQISCQSTNLNYDCDGDGKVGPLDNCPCDSDITTLSQGEKCGTICTKDYKCADGTNLKC